VNGWEGFALSSVGVGGADPLRLSGAFFVFMGEAHVCCFWWPGDFSVFLSVLLFCLKNGVIHL